MKAKNRFFGTFLGGAIGDALGAPVEFKTIRQIIETYGSAGVEGPESYLEDVLEFTDDTQMTLFSAEGILRAICRFKDRGIFGGYTASIWESYLRWLWTQGYEYDHDNYQTSDKHVFTGYLLEKKGLYRKRSPGQTCIRTLLNAKMGTLEKPVNQSKGCGGVMRVAPLGLVSWAENPEAAFRLGAEAAAMTHGHPSGYLSAGFLSCLMSVLKNQALSLEKAIQVAKEPLVTYKGFEETLAAVEKAEDLARIRKEEATWQDVEGLGAGWVGEEALSIALFCSLVHEQDFVNGVLLAVNHSGDSDSTASIAGNILGWINGMEGIPSAWLEKLKGRKVVEQVARDLYLEFEPSENEEDIILWYARYPPF
jgi:ADP-ribosylglycohydrolase